MNRYLICAAIVALTLGAGCKREEKTTTAPSPPPTTPQPPEKAPGMATAPAPADAARTAGQTLDDAGITAKIKTEMAASPDVKALDVNVDTVSGKVTLKGTVDSQSQADRAIQIARETQGVKEVDNQLAVKGKP